MKHCLIVLMVLLGPRIACAAIELPDRPSEEEIRARTGQTNAVLKYETEYEGKAVACTWEISGQKENDGLRVAVIAGDERSEFDLFVGKGIGRVLDLNVKRHQLKTEDLIFGGIASLNSQDQIEYRIFVKRTWDKRSPSEHWALTEPLLIRSLTDYIHGMSLSFPCGDTIMLGLHTLSRKENRIDSHFFVHHCPIPNKTLTSGIKHFSCSVGESEPLEKLLKPAGTMP